MSVAFTREESAETAVEVELPDRPISPHPNLVSASGLEALTNAMTESRTAYDAVPEHAPLLGEPAATSCALAPIECDAQKANENPRIAPASRAQPAIMKHLPTLLRQMPALPRLRLVHSKNLTRLKGRRGPAVLVWLKADGDQYAVGDAQWAPGAAEQSASLEASIGR
jgi:hypothetical protein